MQEPAWLVAGLGNPGPDYNLTRHNVGFMVVDELASIWGVSIKRKECRSLIGQTVFESRKVELAKPQTFMNLSGEAISCFMTDESRSVESLLVVVDDLALPFGSIRLRRQGSDGGHNGLKSVSNCLKTEKYARLRIGIQPDHPLSNAKRFVLERFPKRDLEDLESIVESAAMAVETMLADGIERAMSRFNN